MLKPADFQKCAQTQMKRCLVFFILCCVLDKAWAATTACPKLMRPNSNSSECECIWGTKSADGKSCKNVKLTKENLKCGPEGCKAPLEKQCWTKISDKQAYRKCMGFDGFGFINSDSKKASDSPVVDDSGDCGYAILGRQEDYDYNTVLSQTDLGDKVKSVQGGGDWPGELAVVKAVKSSLSNTPDGCVCPMYSFKYNSKEAYFYNWSNGKELTESVDIMNKNSANSGIRINNNFACLLNEDRTRTDYWIKFVAGCEASSEPNPDTDKHIDLISDVSKISTNSDKPKNVKKLCSASNKKAWKCRTLLKDEHTFYLDPAKSYKDNTELRNYINLYGATDSLHVTTGLQYYGKNRESELLTIFCVPSD